MKILISDEGGGAHRYERIGLAKVFSYCGHNVKLWTLGQEAPFDVFNEFEPDIFITQGYNINRAIKKCIIARPALRVISKLGDWWKIKPDEQKYPILHASKEEIKTIQELRDECNKPDYGFIHNHKDYLLLTHGEWGKYLPIKSSMNAADLFSFVNSVWNEAFMSDVCFIGGYWKYKSITLNQYLLPLCSPNLNLKIKIFGNQNWSVPQYCGFAQDEYVKDLLKSAAICPNVSELHSQDFGGDIIERPFKLASNKCFIVSDYVEALEKIYGDSIVYGKTPEDFKEKILYFLKNPQEKMKHISKAYKITLENHTYFDRVATIFDNLNMKWESNNVRIAKMKFIQDNNL